MKFSIRETFLGKKYHFLNTIWINKKALLSNYKYLRSINKKIKIAPVLKSNAYGHGLIQIATLLDSLQIPYFCVDSLYEAYELLKAKIKTPILIMGYTDPDNLKVKELPFSYVVWDLKLLDVVSKYQKGAVVHLKVDTGMHRLGVDMEYLDWFVSNLAKFPNVKVAGLMSHLAEGERPNSSLTKLQIKNFDNALKILQKYKIKPKWIHIANSAGLLNLGLQQAGVIGNMARIGKALYGIDPTDGQHPKLKPVLKFTSKIIQIKRLKKGDMVGYEGSFVALRDMLIGSLPAGYYDGVDRRLSNKGVVLVDGAVFPIIGKVSMNITTIDISKVGRPFIGQEVVIYSDNPQDPNCLKKAAQICQTVPYELLAHEVAATRREVIG